MKIICKPTKDTFITNKKLAAGKDAKRSNVGQSGTLDLFKIYNSKTEQSEISRILLKFDLSNLRKEIINNINLNNPKFRAWLRLFDVKTGNIVPLNYKICCLPLAKNFDEGYGNDSKFFSNLDISNFVVSSYDSQLGEINWNTEGAGTFGESREQVDAFESIQFQENNSSISLVADQFLSNGHEDLMLDITNAVSGILSNQIADCGFLLFFSGSYETDDETRFIKSFASRHSVNRSLHPRIEISYDDSYFDNFDNFAFNISNNLYFKNFVRNSLVNYRVPNLANPPSFIEATGNNCLKLVISYHDYANDFNVSQVRKGTNSVPISGMYVAENVLISSFEVYDRENELTFQDLLNSNKDIKMTVRLIHVVNGMSTLIKQCCLIIKNENSCSKNQPNYVINTSNLSSSYSRDQIAILRLFINDTNKNLRSTRVTTLNKKSELLGDLHYRLRDAVNGKLMFDFDFNYKSTKISYDLDSMFFRFDFSIVDELGKPYHFEFGLRDSQGNLLIFKDHSNFIVE